MKRGFSVLLVMIVMIMMAGSAAAASDISYSSGSLGLTTGRISNYRDGSKRIVYGQTSHEYTVGYIWVSVTVYPNNSNNIVGTSGTGLNNTSIVDTYWIPTYGSTAYYTQPIDALGYHKAQSGSTVQDCFTYIHNASY